ncbi:phosphoserine phosphatase [Sorangium cellulosum]|nr:phosphoserine phosphatase [Sorangium cellulosum]
MATKRPTIALLTDYLCGEYQSEARFGAAEAHDVNLVIAFGETRARRGYSLLDARGSIYSLVGAATVDGAVIMSSALTNALGADGMHEFCRSYAPLPVCSVGVALEGIPSVVVDNALGGEVAVAHVVDDHARQRVAYISGPPGNTEAKLRARAYRRALEARALPYDERLLVHGDFLIDGGRSAMRELLARGVRFDAVVAGNDNMALGAMDTLKAHGIGVPGDVLVCGFDDVAVSRVARPSLTTVRQPIKELGALAVATVLRQLAGERVPECSLLPELTRRESCGCGYYAALPRASAEAPSRRAPRSIAEQREDLTRALERAVTASAASLRDWPRELLSALEEELAGQEGRFLRALQDLLDAAGRECVALDQLQGAITLLRARVRRAPGVAEGDLERLWHTARVLIGNASVRAEGEKRLRLERASIDLSWTGMSFSTSLSMPTLRRTLAAELPRLDLTHVAVSLYDDPQRATLRSLFLMENSEVEPPPASFASSSLAPPGFLSSAERWSVIAMPITFGEGEHFGIALVNSGANEVVYDAVRLQIGSAMKAVMMHREIVRQVEIRERLEQERVRQESVVAERIQTTLIPPRLHVEGLELCAAMRPAAEVGGDYYDVIATPEGGWLGLIMLMIQSMVACMARKDPTASPGELISALNRAIHENIRDRLKRDEHATLLLLRYERSGRVTFAGAHDDLVVCRAGTRRCECVASSGVWIGVLPSVDAMTRDADLLLEDGDLLVLYTDGVTEARNAQQEQFGLERLCAAVEASQDAPVDVIRDRLLRDVESWCSSPDDDITLLVARHRAPPGAA